MALPNPNELRARNKGKSFLPKGEKPESTLTPEEKEERRQKRISEDYQKLYQKAETDLERYKGAAIVIGCKYISKEAVLAVMQALVDQGWAVKKSYDASEQEIILSCKEQD